MLFVILSVMIYMVIGAHFSRSRYARLVGDHDTAARRRELKHEAKTYKSITNVTGLRHTSNCRSHEWSSLNYKIEHCNCGSKKRTSEIQNELRYLTIEPGVVAPMIGWPVYFMVAYLKGGTPKRSPESIAELIERQEKELQIGV